MRHIKYIISIIILVGYVKGISQCPSQTLIFTSQQQIDDFILNYPDCNRISGALIIDESEVNNILGLANLSYVGADVMIENNDNLINFDGLESLDSIGQSLIIRNNQNLVDIDALSSLSYIGKNIRFTGFDKITTVDGFIGIDHVRGNLGITFHDELIDINGLSNIDSIDGELKLQINDKLTNLYGLRSLKKIKGGITQISGENILSLKGLDSLELTGAVWIEDMPRLKSLEGLENWRIADTEFINLISSNDSLTTLKGLDNLERVGDLFFTFNPRLKNLDGLESLKIIDRSLSINNMDSLENLDALINLEKVGTELRIRNVSRLESLFGIKNIDYSEMDLLTIFDNDLLEVCAVRSICDYLEAGGPYEIYNNKEGCQDADTILTICETVSSDDLEYYDIDIYPNPVIDFLSIKDLPFATEIQLYSLEGKLLKSYHNIQYGVDVSDIGAGMYILIVKEEGKFGMQKFIKAK